MTSDLRPERSLVPAAATLAAYVALAILQTWPLVRHLGTHLPGLGLGDNVSFVWNLWWMREAIGSSAWTFFNTPLLFAPLGAPLVLHTHTAALAWVGATLLSPVSVVTAQNLLLIASVALNGWSMWLLARSITGDMLASFVSGVIVLMSPLVATRLMGHFNLVPVWPLTLACLAFVTWWRRLDRGAGPVGPAMNRVSAVCLGVAAGLLPFFDYYYSIYFLIVAVVYATASLIAIDTQRTRRSSRIPTIAAGVIAVLALAAAVAIAGAKQDSFRIAGIRISARTPTNALTLVWLAGLVAWAFRWRWQLKIRRLPSPPITTLLRAAVLPLIVAVLLVSPLVRPAERLWRSGGYVTQQSGLRSGPGGVDLATLAVAPPFHGMAGESARKFYRRFEIDPMESSAYVGWATLFLAVTAWQRLRQEPAVRGWGVVLAVFGIWALGPYLTVLGQNTGLILPGAVLRFVPIVNNARIPGRALFVVTIGASVLSAIALRTFSPSRRTLTFAVVLAAIAVESLWAPIPLTIVPPAGVYTRVAADRSNAAVLPIPFGIRDGFGERGRVEPDAILQQTRHRHPIAGGFLARLPPDIPEWYGSHEPFATLLRLSSPAEAMPVPCEVSRRGFESAHVGFVVVYEDASEALRRFVATLPLTRLDDDGERVLYRVGGCSAGR